MEEIKKVVKQFKKDTQNISHNENIPQTTRRGDRALSNFNKILDAIGNGTLPAGGNVNQFLKKRSPEDFDVTWQSLAEVAISGDYNDLINIPPELHLIQGENILLSGTFPNITITALNNYVTGVNYSGNTLTLSRNGLSALTATFPNYLTEFNETDPIFVASPAYSITDIDIAHWNEAYGWGDHHGLYKSISYVPDWFEITNKPTIPVQVNLIQGANISITGTYPNLTISATGISDTNNYPTSLNFSGHTLTLGRSGLSDLTTTFPDYLTSYSETDPIWNSEKSNYLTIALAATTYHPLENQRLSSFNTPYFTGLTSNGDINITNGAAIFQEGYFSRYGSVNQINGHDGKMGVLNAFGEGLVIIGTQTIPGNGRKITLLGDVYGSFIGSLIGNATSVTNGVYTTGSYSDPTWLTSLAYAKITGVPAFLTSETDPTVGSHIKAISTTDISNWNTAYSWGNHAGLYKLVSYVPTWTEITGKPSFATVATSGDYNDLINKPSIPAQVNLIEGANITITGTYPNITITAATGAASDGNNYPTALSYSGNTLTLSRSGLSVLTATFPAYLTSYTETDPVWTSDKPNYLTSAIAASTYSVLGHTHTFASLTSKPSTLAGYGITDAYPLVGNPSGFLTSISAAGSNTQVQYNNSGAFGASSTFTYDGALKVVYNKAATSYDHQPALTVVSSNINNSDVSIEIQNTAASGKIWNVRSLATGDFDVRIITDIITGAGVTPMTLRADGLVQFYKNIEGTGSGGGNKFYLGDSGGVMGLHLNTTTPTTSNYAVYSDGSNTYFNGASSNNLRVNNSTKISLSSSSVTLSANTLLQSSYTFSAGNVVISASNSTISTIGLKIFNTGGGGFFTTLEGANLTADRILTLPTVSGTLVATVNGTSPNAAGNVTVAASPAGSTTQIQYNNAGSMGASSNLTWDNTNKTLSTYKLKGSGTTPTITPGSSFGAWTFSVTGTPMTGKIVATAGGSATYNTDGAQWFNMTVEGITTSAYVIIVQASGPNNPIVYSYTLTGYPSDIVVESRSSSIVGSGETYVFYYHIIY